jgi:hypothetical protein
MPVIDIAHQHLIAARANGGDQLDWSSMVGGQRISAGLPPFTKQVSGLTHRGSGSREGADLADGEFFLLDHSQTKLERYD